MTAESHCSPTGISLEDTGYGYTLSVINGKYKMIILYWLALYKPVLRFNELQRCIGTISYKTLSSTLKELEKDRPGGEKGVSADPAQGGVQPVRARAFADPGDRHDVQLGEQHRPEQPVP